MGVVEQPSEDKGSEEDHVHESIYEDVPLASMTFCAGDDGESKYTYECPCGDLFEIYLDELHDGESIAYCPSCTLKVRVLFDAADLPALQ